MKYFLIGLCLTLMSLPLWASGSHHHNNTTINNYDQTQTNIEYRDETDDTGSAAAAAMSQCHPSASIVANQNCLGVGHDFNTDSTALTYGHFKRGKFAGDRAMWGGTATVEQHRKLVVGFGVNF